MQAALDMNGHLWIRGGNPVVASHRVHGLKIFPGLAYIDLLFQYFRKRGHEFTQMELRNLAIYTPLVLPGEDDILLDVRCNERRAGLWQLSMEGIPHRDGQPAGERRKYATAEMQRVDAIAFDPPGDDAASALSVQRRDAEDIYAVLRALGLVHNGLMKVDGEGGATGTMAFADLRLSAAASASSSKYMFHPALLDGAVVCASAMLPASDGGGSGSGNLYLPLLYQSFRAKALIRGSCTARIAVSSVKMRNDLCSFSVDFLDADGRKVAELKELVLKAVRSPELITQQRAAAAPSAPPRAQSGTVPVTQAAPAYGSKDLLALAGTFVSAAIAQRLGVDGSEINATAGYYEMGMDSAGLLELVRHIEDKLGLSLPPTLLFEHVTVADLAGYLVEHHAAEVAALGSGTPMVVQHAMPAAPAPVQIPVRKLSPPVATSELSPPAASGEDIAIIGMAGRFPKSQDIRELWSNLLDGVDCVTEIPPQRWDWHVLDGVQSASGGACSRWGGFIDDAECFDALFFRVPPRAAVNLDPQERLFLETSWEAIEDAGYTPATLVQAHGPNKRRRVGVYAGVMHNENLVLQTQRLVSGELQVLALSNGAIANRVSYICNFHGPSMVVDTLCSSSLSAAHLAINSLRAGESEVALAGGVNLSLHPGKYLSFALAGMHSSDGRCRTFGKGGDGYVPAEGVGVVVLKLLQRAEADGDHIYAVIKGSSINHVGSVSGITVPSPVAQADLIANCLEETGIDPRTISYVEAHGTGTSLGDPIEVEGLTRAWRRYTQDVHFCAIGSIKSNMGHAESAAGVSGLIKVALQLQHRTLVTSLHSEDPNPYIDWQRSPFIIQRTTAPWPAPSRIENGVEIALPRRAAVSSFGAAGSNAHLILEEYQDAHPAGFRPLTTHDSRLTFLVPLSAHSAEQVRRYAQRLLAFLQAQDAEIERLAYTLQIGREAFSSRAAFVVADAGELQQALAEFIQADGTAQGSHHGRRFVGEVKQGAPGVGLLASDEDSQELLERWLAKGKVDKLAELWTQGFAVDWQRLYGPSRPRRMSLPTYPFNRERHWIDMSKRRPAATQASAARAVLHPLLQENTSDLGEQRFTSVFSGGEFYLSDHLVNGMRVLPGVAYLEMAQAALTRAAGMSVGEGRGIRIRNVVWAQPIVVGEEPATVHIGLHAREDGEVDYEVYSERVADAARTVRVIHSQGAAASARLPELHVDLAALQAGRRTQIDVEECYRLLAASGLAYGAAFQAMQQVWVGEDVQGMQYVLAELAVPQVINDASGAYLLHPSVLDSALQSSIGLALHAAQAEAGENSNPYLPYALEQLDIAGHCGNKAWAVVRHAPGTAGRLRKLDVQVCDAGGKVCVYLHGFTARLVEKVPVAASSAAEQALLTFEECWRAEPLPPQANPMPATLVCLLSDATLQKQAEQALQPGSRVIFIARGAASCKHDALHYTVASHDAQGYADTLRDIAAEHGAPGALLNLWAVEAPDLLDDYQDTVALLQALGGFDAANLRVLLAGRCVTALQRCYLDSRAGFAVSLKRLLRHTLQVIGFDGSVDMSACLARLAAEVRSPATPHVFYDGEQRQVPRQEATARTISTPMLRKGGTYLVTGGLGALGWVVAEHLASKYGANLILTGRSALDATKRARIERLQSHGGKVFHAPVDVSDAAAMQAALAQAREVAGAPHGVFHIAGISAGANLFEAAYPSFAQVLAPKVAGTLVLEEALADVPLDFFCHFSSSAAVLGDFGACAYAVANRFQMAHARYTSAPAGAARGRRIALNWPLWKEGGMGVGDAAATALYLQTSGQRALDAGEGLQLLEQLLGESPVQQLVLAGYPAVLRRLLGFAPSEAAAAEFPAGESAGTVEEDAEDALHARTVSLLRKLLAATLQLPMEKLGATTPLDQYELDSIMVMQMTNELEKSFGSLSKTLFFEYQNIDALSRYFLGSHAPALRRLFGVADKALPQAAGKTSAGRARRAVAPAVSQPATLAAPTQQQDIAIVGLSGRYPQAADVQALWDNLRKGVDCVSEIPPLRWDAAQFFDERKGQFGRSYCKWGGFLAEVDQFDALFFNLAPLDAQFIDPQQRLFLETVWNLLEGSGYTRQRLQSSYEGNVGVYVGSMYNQYGTVQADIASDAVSNSPQGGIANRVSYFFGLQGPSIAIDTMCSSAAMAIHMACNDLRQRTCRLAIAGGVNLSLHPKKFIGLSQAGMLGSNPQGRSFGDADGYLPAEAVSAVLLKPLQHAVEEGDQLLAVIKGSATNHGGRSNGYSVPSPNAQAQVIEAALRNARVAAESVGYVEAAANGSALGDAIEMTALGKVFGNGTRICPIGAVKSNMGHAEAASAMPQLAKVILQLQHRQLVPSIKADRLNPNIRFEDSIFRLQRELSDWPRLQISENGRQHEVPRRALINSFGAGGSNVCLLVEEYTQPQTLSAAEHASGEPHIMVFSAQEGTVLKALVARMLAYFKDSEPLPLADVAYTLQCGREAMTWRLALVASSHAELCNGLQHYLEHGSGGDVPLFCGAPQENTSVAAFTTGKAGEALLRTFMRSRDLENLALLWSKGGSIAWAELYPQRRARIVALPGYPFNRQRYWVPQSADLSALPLTSTNAAPAPALSLPERDIVQPRNELEATVQGIWQEVLGFPQIGVYDNFLALGGNSLSAVRVIARLKEQYDVDVGVSAILTVDGNIVKLTEAVVAELARQAAQSSAA